MTGSFFNTLLLLLMLISMKVTAQDSSIVPVFPVVITDIKVYKEVVHNNPSARMADVKKMVPQIILDLRYATENNFMHRKLYPFLTTTYMRTTAVKALDSIETELQSKGLGLKIFDAYRPFSITRQMWELVGDERYVANPAKGSGHNRGAAVDLTIISLRTKQELDMGTGFDNFSDTAHHTFMNLPEDVLRNRRYLKDIMERHGFAALETEWWHYSLNNAKDYDLLDIGFKKMSLRK